MTSNAIQKFQYQPPQAFGSNEEVNAIIERMEALLPIDLGASPEASLVKALNNSYLRAAQLSVFYRLIPGTDVHIIRFGKTFSVDIGVEAWKKAADRYCSHHRITFHAHYEALSLEEIKARRGKDWTPQDVGYVCYLWRSDKAEVYKIFGGNNPKEALTKGYGHWAEKARWDNNKKEWYSDTIPVQRTKEDVARRRALKAALKAEFSLDSLLAAAPDEVSQALTYLNTEAETAKISPIIQRPEVILDENGFVVTSPRSQPEEPPYDEYDYDDVIDAEAEIVEEPEATLEEAFDPAIVKEYLAVSKSLTGMASTLRDWSRRMHNESQGEAHLIQYRILVGEVEKLIGKDNHHYLFGVLLGRAVHSENRPGEKFVRLLLSQIQEEVNVLGDDGKPTKDKKGRNVKEVNSSYNQKTVEAIRETWRQANPQPALATEITETKPGTEGGQLDIPF